MELNNVRSAYKYFTKRFASLRVIQGFFNFNTVSFHLCQYFLARICRVKVINDNLFSTESSSSLPFQSFIHLTRIYTRRNRSRVHHCINMISVFIHRHFIVRQYQTNSAFVTMETCDFITAFSFVFSGYNYTSKFTLFNNFNNLTRGIMVPNFCSIFIRVY